MSEQSSSTPRGAGKKRPGAAKKAGAGKGGRAGKAGRPSLDQAGKPSAQIAFRVASPVRKRAKEVAEKEGLTVSQLGRKALRQYLATQEGAGS